MCFRIEIKTKYHVANQFNQNSYGLANTRRLPCFTQKEIAVLIKRIISLGKQAHTVHKWKNIS